MLNPKSLNRPLSSTTWLATMNVEYSALIKMPPGLLFLSHMAGFLLDAWGFSRVKENSDDSINKYKVRLVANGFHRRYGDDYSETFSSVIKHVTVRALTSLATRAVGCS